MAEGYIFGSFGKITSFEDVEFLFLGETIFYILCQILIGIHFYNLYHSEKMRSNLNRT